MVDADVLDTTTNAWSPTVILAGLLTHEQVHSYRYSDQGPPASASTMPGLWGSSHAVGWVTAKPNAPGDLVTHEVAWCDGKAITKSAITGDIVEFASGDSRTPAYKDLATSDAITRRTRDAVAAEAAACLQADLFITNRPYLHAASWSRGDGVTICTPNDALPMLSLYLRTRGEFLTWRSQDGKGTHTVQKGLFYWVGTRELLPAGWRWFDACLAHDHHCNSDRLTYLGGAVFQRVARTLQVRDDLHRAMNRHQDYDVVEGAMIALDTCLLFLMGAVDATSRVAHHVLELPSSQMSRAGWQKSEWLRSVARTAPDLAAVVGPDSPSLDTLTVLRLLRNTVHGPGLSALAVGAPGRRQETFVGLPTAESKEILAALDRRGGREAWGIHEVIPGRIHADPGMLLERLLPASLSLLDDLMRWTPVERLSGTKQPRAGSGPPPPEPSGPWDERTRQSVRWQLGL